MWKRGKKLKLEKGRLGRVYKIKAKVFMAKMEELKQRISAMANRVKRHANKQKQLEQNRLFDTNQRLSFFPWNIKGGNGETLPLDPEDTTKF